MWGLEADAAQPATAPAALPFREAARVIMSATHLLIAAGAGFSADSGLPVYDQIADEPAWKERGVTYGDLCRPAMLTSDPGVAFGFWGTCFNKYRETRPHRGYSILRRWCAGKQGWYVYTSNVDGHFEDSGFDPERVLEIHGSLRRWLPRSAGAGGPVLLEHSHRFQVDETSRVLAAGLRSMEALNGDAEGTNLVDTTEAFRQAGVPVDSGGALMRPGVLMFDDEYAPLLALLEHDQAKYQKWEEEVEKELETSGATRLAIIELGCGTRVPAVRMESECVLKEASERAAACAASGGAKVKDRVCLIRVNPDFPLNPRDPDRTISLQCSALTALEAIEMEMEKERTTQNQIGGEITA